VGASQQTHQCECGWAAVNKVSALFLKAIVHFSYLDHVGGRAVSLGEHDSSELIDVQVTEVVHLQLIRKVLRLLSTE